MRDIKIILTACGCPGAAAFIKQLKSIRERRVRIIGADMHGKAIGKFFADGFYKVPRADAENYIDALLDICRKESPDILFPVSSYEVYPVSLNKSKFEKLGVKVLVSEPEALKVANNKFMMYEVLKEKTAIELPKYFYPRNLKEFVKYAEELGYPEKAVCIKPHIGKGNRGVRIINPRINRKELLLNYAPDSKYMALNEFIEIFKYESDFPDFLIMDFLEGENYATDNIAFNFEYLFGTVKTMENLRWGMLLEAELRDKKELIEQSREIASVIRLEYCWNAQFIGNKIIEINPRISTFIYQEDLIAPYLAIKLALGELTPAQVKEYQSKIHYGRNMVRYMDQINLSPDLKTYGER